MSAEKVEHSVFVVGDKAIECPLSKDEQIKALLDNAVISEARIEALEIELRDVKDTDFEAESSELDLRMGQIAALRKKLLRVAELVEKGPSVELSEMLAEIRKYAGDENACWGCPEYDSCPDRLGGLEENAYPESK